MTLRVDSWLDRLGAGAGGFRRAGPVLVTAIYGAIVVWVAAHHEPWRDEVVPLSIARRARSLAELAAPLRFEGHPILWYLVLWLGYRLVGAAWVLKAASIASAVGAVFLLNRSPLPWWLRWSIAFSFFPLYQYSVVSRGYSLLMLLLFASCALYPRRREHPVAFALLLAALANTEVFGLIMAVAMATMVAVEGVPAARWREVVSDRWVQGAAAVFLCGLVAAASVAFPDPGHPLTGFRALDIRRVAAGIGWAIAQPAAHSASLAILPVPSLWLWLYFAYLTPRPPVLCFAAVSFVGMEVLFNLVYGPRAPWHIGNVVLALVATMWLDASEPAATGVRLARLERARTWLGRLLAVGVAALFAGHVLMGVDHIRADVRYEHSSNKRLAELLRSDPELATAVVMGEPDTPLWSLPYYANNRIYLGREAAFRDWGVFSPSRPVTYDLGALLAAARGVRDECDCPVVITLGWELGRIGTYINFRGSRFEERFVITADQQAEFLAATRPLARLRGPTITDENYDVYVLR